MGAQRKSNCVRLREPLLSAYPNDMMLFADARPFGHALVAALFIFALGCEDTPPADTPDGSTADGQLIFPDNGFTRQDLGVPVGDGPLDGPVVKDDGPITTGDGPITTGDGPMVADQSVVDVYTTEQCTTEGQTRGCKTTLPAPCDDGNQQCQNGYWTGCSPEVKPGDRQQDCKGTLDNDCDGHKAATDPDCRACEPYKEQDCDSQKPGICKAGKQQCELDTSDGVWRWNKCVEGITVGSQQEACTDPTAQGEDRDCDGRPAALDGDCNPCYDGAKNGTETDIDCGGLCPNRCAETKGCAVHADCAQGNCFLGKCGPNLCKSGVKESHETDVDCGGQCPDKCAQGKGCLANTDCISGRCQNKKCVVCSFNNPTASGSGACPSNWNCSYQMREVTGDGNRLKIKCVDNSGECGQSTVYSYVDLGSFTASGSGACPSNWNCSYQMREISGDGSRLKIKCVDNSGECGQSTVYSYITLTGATASGSGACPSNWNCNYQMREISGDGNRLKIKCVDNSGECGQSTVYAYVDLGAVETCQ